jgi:hypothetical protein
MRAVVVGFGNEHFGKAIQVAIVGGGRVHEFLGANDAVLFEHDEEHLGVDDRAGVEKLHGKNLTTNRHEFRSGASAERRILFFFPSSGALRRYGWITGIWRRLVATLVYANQTTYHQTESLVNFPSTIRQIFRALLFFNSTGNAASGKF